MTVFKFKNLNYHLAALSVPGVEIIVVDDCSTDQTIEVVRGFEGVRVISNQINKGPIQAIVTGIKAARHELVVS